MKKFDIRLPSEAAVRTAMQDDSWTLGNQVLYDMCRNHPSQSDPMAIVSKFWLIGRAYSAAVERRRTSNEKPLSNGENFYDHRLVPIYQQADFDSVFAPLYGYENISSNLKHVIEIHCTLTQTLKDVTGQWKRSLASKYLHFHFPNLFYIYDSRAESGLGGYVPQWHKQSLPTSYSDPVYYKFSLAMTALRDEIKSHYGLALSPRHLDTIVL
jgi:hypothetical protein